MCATRHSPCAAMKAAPVYPKRRSCLSASCRSRRAGRATPFLAFCGLLTGFWPDCSTREQGQPAPACREFQPPGQILSQGTPSLSWSRREQPHWFNWNRASSQEAMTSQPLEQSQSKAVFCPAATDPLTVSLVETRPCNSAQAVSQSFRIVASASASRRSILRLYAWRTRTIWLANQQRFCDGSQSVASLSRFSYRLSCGEARVKLRRSEAKRRFVSASAAQRPLSCASDRATICSISVSACELKHSPV